jgi:hypothetical protein
MPSGKAPRKKTMPFCAPAAGVLGPPSPALETGASALPSFASEA